MPATVKGIIYGATSKVIRRIVIPTNSDAELNGHVGTGEALLTVPINDPLSLEQAEAAVAAATGVTPPSRRCVVVHGNTVQAVISADPDLDGIPGRSLYRHATAHVGWTRNPNGDFEPPGQTDTGTPGAGNQGIRS